MTSEHNINRVVLDGASLTLDDLITISTGSARIHVPDGVLAALKTSNDVLIRARESGRVYGANTGVGANRALNVEVSGSPEEIRAAHARRLLLSHCAGAGRVDEETTVRAAMAVRLNQFLAGGSGISTGVVVGLLEALNNGAVASIHSLGGLGTGDLAAMAELALTLSGDRPWQVGGIAPVHFEDTDSLPFMSSSALTLATAAQGAVAMEELLKSALVVSSLTLLALEGSPEPYAPAVHQGRNHPHQTAVASSVRQLTGPDTPAVPARLQDPFALRALPQVHAPALDALERLRSVIETECNGAAENPLMTSEGVFHHGQFHLAMLSAALDGTRSAVYPVISLSAARLSHLFRPELSGLPSFLSAGPRGSSGLMIAEYVAQDVLSVLRTLVTPANGPGISVSLGLEEHAGFATQGARQLRQLAAEAPAVVALEAVAAVRALRMAPHRLGSAPVRDAFEYLAAGLDPETDDRPLGDDLAAALALLPGLVRFSSQYGSSVQPVRR
ncbi:histidine ammonia-lyase [Arthrobacter sp. CAN_A212]|uniref:aromatic amino acid lyase n=1 Tax=unclassified Arthrobacter TaxID=235627 RepID=UPI0018CB70F6|nr:aromatic amino acid lyase [Arthrobacter sp. CAN_C5]MBP2216267.1 histidine ammonia-lyase [Arthrobacter sp. CAN_C5]